MARWRSGALHGDAADGGPNDGPPNDGVPPPGSVDEGRRDDADDFATRPAWEKAPALEPDVLAGGWDAPRPRRHPTPRRTAGPSPSADPEATVDAPAPIGRVERLRRWASNPRAWVSALVIGVALGAVGMHAYDAKLAEQTRRDAVVLAARVAADDLAASGGGRGSWLLPIVLTNNGVTTVRIHAARLLDGQLRSTLRRVSGDVVLAPGQETRITLVVVGACPGGGPVTPPRSVALTVAGTGRPNHEVTVQLADDRAQLLAAARQTCLDADFGLWISARSAGGPATSAAGLRIPIRFRLNGARPQEVSAVRTAAPGLLAVASPLPVRFRNGLSPVVTLRWVVSDCVQARGLGYEQIRLRAVVALSPGTTTAAEVIMVLDGDVLLSVVRYVTASCG